MLIVIPHINLKTLYHFWAMEIIIEQNVTGQYLLKEANIVHGTNCCM